MVHWRKTAAHLLRNPQDLKNLNLSLPNQRARGTSHGGGRLNNSHLAYSQCHLIIIHGRNKLTKLIVSSKHIFLLLSGPPLLLSILGSSYHRVGARKLIRKLIRAVCHRCVTCRKVSSRTEKQLMGQLPSQGVTPTEVFRRTGMDFAGPLITKKEY